MYNKIILTEADIDTLREKIRPYYTEKRYLHTLSVEKEAVKLGEIYLHDELMRLRAAALLHDITKIADYEKQLQYCAEFGIIMNIEEGTSPEVLHALTGASVAERDFVEFVDDGIVGAIRRHTTGDGAMTVFDALIYLADYIEETRTFEGCRALRSYFWDRIECGDDKKEVLLDTLIHSFDMTVKHLLDKGSVIDLNTIEARNICVARKLFADE